MAQNTVTLASIRESVEAKYASTVVELVEGEPGVELVNPLRLDKAARKELQAVSEQLKAEDSDVEEVLGSILVKVARHKKQGEALVAACGNDAAILAAVFESYIGGVEAGEASPSES